jgi:hypothetical protein
MSLLIIILSLEQVIYDAFRLYSKDLHTYSVCQASA